MPQELSSSVCSSVNPQVPGRIEARRVTVAPDHQDPGGAGVVEPPLTGLQEEVRLLSPAGGGLDISDEASSKLAD